MEIKAIETRYKGFRFRSRLEARWAVFFDVAKVAWEYEPQGYKLPSGPYLPDFWLTDLESFVEVKPPLSTKARFNLYLAGKMSVWRKRLNRRGHDLAGPEEDGCGHQPGLHGAELYNDPTPTQVFQSCLMDVSAADGLFVWIESLDSYATLAEIGYARALGDKFIYTGVSSTLKDAVAERSGSVLNHDDNHGSHRLHDLWFIEKLSNRFGFFPKPQAAFDEWLGTVGDDETKCAELSSGGSPVALVRGDPLAPRVYSEFRDGHPYFRDLKTESLAMFLHRPIAVISEAADAARTARFEHGEKGAQRA